MLPTPIQSWTLHIVPWAQGQEYHLSIAGHGPTPFFPKEDNYSKCSVFPHSLIAQNPTLVLWGWVSMSYPILSRGLYKGLKHGQKYTKFWVWWISRPGVPLCVVLWPCGPHHCQVHLSDLSGWVMLSPNILVEEIFPNRSEVLSKVRS